MSSTGTYIDEYKVAEDDSYMKDNTFICLFCKEKLMKNKFNSIQLMRDRILIEKEDIISNENNSGFNAKVAENGIIDYIKGSIKAIGPDVPDNLNINDKILTTSNLIANVHLFGEYNKYYITTYKELFAIIK